MEVNQYDLYSVNANNDISSNEAQIQEDIKTMDSINDYQEIINFVELRYGKLEDLICKEFSNKIRLGIAKGDNFVEIVVTKNQEKIIFGKRWRFIPDEEPTPDE